MLWFHSVTREQRCLPGPPTSEVLFHYVYQEEKPLLSFGQQQLRISLDSTNSHISQPIRGMICLRLQTKVAICNPGTKKFQTLPDIQAHKDAVVTSFLGYDEATKVFKVLCVTMLHNIEPSLRAYDYQVLTVELGEEPSSSWRRITCTKDHQPETQGLCKGGILYYGARSTSHEPLVMKFDVRSEEFTVIEFPDLHISTYWNFVIYNGKIALVNDSDFLDGIVNEPNGDIVFHIWVRDETAREWQRTHVEILS
ncbi:hypothetical protein CARUB_v10024949mg [Capsella rubella]|uniref:F-box associated beta-propeller type 3 domain-containing protein n=1 Tax=Capsella rubella TaxID=81985 RepID=R0HTJ1_9BRAS|nr:hypothetical protein CARUB_v10024949mg [Capsella rubella]